MQMESKMDTAIDMKLAAEMLVLTRGHRTQPVAPVAMLRLRLCLGQDWGLSGCCEPRAAGEAGIVSPLPV